MIRKPLLVAFLLALGAHAQETPPPELEALSLEELMNVEVVSASNISERLAEAPATVIVVSRQEIRERGYTELTEIFDDMPGMDIVRPWGDTHLKNYWRGYRNTIGDPFLVMIDGVVFNHLYFNTADVLATFPITDVERVEIVYGPASSVYGASAFMGVVNVITRDDALKDGAHQNLQVSAGSAEARLVDATYVYKRDDIRVRFSARVDEGMLDDQFIERYEYTRTRYFADRRLWGGFVDDREIGGGFSSPRRNRAVDLRLTAGNVEVAAQYFRFNAGYGVAYAGDRGQNHAVWSRPDFSGHVRLGRALSERVRSSTMLRYRSSGVADDSYFVQSFPGQPHRAEFSYWSVDATSLSLFQDFDIKMNDALAIRAGVRYEQKDLQKAYEITYGPALPPSEIDVGRYPYPEPPSSRRPHNRVTTEDSGLYVQTWYRLSEQHRLNVGMRQDRNSRYGNATTFRLGYVGSYDRWGLKALFGQAFQEPNNRLLYGGWDGSGSDPELRPERSSTIEVSATYTAPALRHLVSLYRVGSHNTFVNTAGGAQNLGDREVVGFDYHAQALLSPGGRQCKVWGYYSHLLRASEATVPGDEPTTNIGDLARNQVHGGVTMNITNDLVATLRGRWVGDRETVVTNPVRRVPSFTTLDAFVRYDDFPARNMGVSLKVANLTNRAYFHPGIRDASAGTTPGSFDSEGVWHGSGGYFNSLLPQPGRTYLVSLHLDQE